MKTFNHLKFKKHPNGFARKHATMKFANGYGVSIVQGGGAYAGPNTYELAVLKDGDLCYSTPVADDVLGYQTPEEITKHMRTIQRLKK